MRFRINVRYNMRYKPNKCIFVNFFFFDDFTIILRVFWSSESKIVIPGKKWKKIK